ncbi:hypothetical protein ACHAXN_008040 [Cyclotella atomus]
MSHCASYARLFSPIGRGRNIMLASSSRLTGAQRPTRQGLCFSSLPSNDSDLSTDGSNRKSKLKDDGLTLSHFIAKTAGASVDVTLTDAGVSIATPADSFTGDYLSNIPAAANIGDEFDDMMVTDAMSCSTQSRGSVDMFDQLKQPFVNDEEDISTFKFHIKTYGCQMNVNDSDIVRSILLNHNATQEGDTAYNESNPNIRFVETNDEVQADVLLTNTCAIRENAEQKVWNRLRELRSHDRNYPLLSLDAAALENTSKEQRKQRQRKDTKKRIIGVLGCMAERLKEDMFKDGTADLVVGPDAYRDLPRLVSILSPAIPALEANVNKQKLPTERAVNVQLSIDETYASITPVRSNPEDVSAFVSIMRGCNNMCSYCVVPFTRGRERSRDMVSIVEETTRLVEEEGIKEVVLLGQNVNSYHDLGDRKRQKKRADLVEDNSSTYQTSNSGFSNMFRLRDGEGHRFVDLLEAVSSISPELRVRFTSPHPKDYPPPLLTLMSERANICNHLHMPAQSGSTSVLERMRRGYSREAYLELIDDVKRLIPDVAISSDFISGFCGETEEEHQETLSLMEQVKFDQAFMFAYSMRGKTHAHRTMEDDVPPEVKNRRLNEVINLFRNKVQERNDQMEVGKLRLVLVEGEAKKSSPENRMWSGRTDQNKRCVFPDTQVFWTEDEIQQLISTAPLSVENANEIIRTPVRLSPGDYAVIEVTEARGHTLKGQGLWRSSIVGFNELMTSQHGNLDVANLSDSLLRKQLI